MIDQNSSEVSRKIFQHYGTKATCLSLGSIQSQELSPFVARLYVVPLGRITAIAKKFEEDRVAARPTKSTLRQIREETQAASKKSDKAAGRLVAI